jgi:succinate dehydrogenase/fumarate reductase flavoprotein subunit
MIWDERTARTFAGRFPLPPEGMSAPYVLHAESTIELAVLIDAHLQRLARRSDLTPGDARLDISFVTRLDQTIERYNGFARAGHDADFQRGAFPLDNALHGPRAPDNGLPNKTMFPLDLAGGLYAMVLVCAAFDTRCGPRIDEKGRVLAPAGKPIAGLYGAGNCVSAVLGEGYPGGGSTIGPALTFGYLAGSNAAARTVAS